jgi:hypothetical protein
MHKDEISAAIVKFFGDYAAHRVTVPNPYKKNSHLALIETVDVLFFPQKGESKEDIDYTDAFCLTAGISQKLVPELSEYVEFGFSYNQKSLPTAEEREQWAASLVRLALTIFLDEDVQPPFLFEELELLPFTGMNYILVQDWLSHETIYLEATKMPVRLLCLTPLYANEAALIEKIGVDKALWALTVEFEDYERKPADV